MENLFVSGKKEVLKHRVSKIIAKISDWTKGRERFSIRVSELGFFFLGKLGYPAHPYFLPESSNDVRLCSSLGLRMGLKSCEVKTYGGGC